jgi:hypothetical protein
MYFNVDIHKKDEKIATAVAIITEKNLWKVKLQITTEDGSVRDFFIPRMDLKRKHKVNDETVTFIPIEKFDYEFRLLNILTESAFPST